ERRHSSPVEFAGIKRRQREGVEEDGDNRQQPAVKYAFHAFLPQQFLYFLPLPHGHGSLRPTFGVSRLCGLVTSSMALSTMPPPDFESLGGGCDAPPNAPPLSRSGALNWIGKARRKFSNGASELALRKTF